LCILSQELVDSLDAPTSSSEKNDPEKDDLIGLDIDTEGHAKKVTKDPPERAASYLSDDDIDGIGAFEPKEPILDAKKTWLSPRRGRRRGRSRSRSDRESDEGLPKHPDEPLVHSSPTRSDVSRSVSIDSRASRQSASSLVSLASSSRETIQSKLDETLDFVDEIVEDAVRLIPHENVIVSVAYQVIFCLSTYAVPYAIATRVYSVSMFKAFFLALVIATAAVYRFRDYRRIWLHPPDSEDMQQARLHFHKHRQKKIGYSYKHIKRTLQRRALERASQAFRETEPEDMHQRVRVSELGTIPYAHGGYFGCSPFMLCDVAWVGVLCRLQPDVFVEVSRRLGASVESLIHWGENSPLVAAYGVIEVLNGRWQNKDREWRHKIHDSDIPAIEWDVFLDPFIVDKMLQDDGFDIGMNMKLADPLAESLFLRGLIAHGSAPQLMLEQLGGYFRHFNFSRVSRSRKTLGGGMYVQEWLTLFAKGLDIGGGEEESRLESLAEVLEVITKILGGQKLKVVLDLKSRYVPRKIWARLIKASSKYVEVVGVGSFCISEIRGISALVSPHIKWKIHEIIFFHTAGDLQAAAHKGVLRRGDTVFFNAGSLLYNYPANFGEMVGNFKYRWRQGYLNPEITPYGVTKPVDAGLCESTLSTIQAYRDVLDLQIGLYVQEHSIDEGSLNKISKHVNANMHVFSLGLSWGGLEGWSMSGIKPTMFTATDGLWKQRYVGKSWDFSKTPAMLNLQTKVLPSATPARFIKERGTYNAGQDRGSLAAFGRQLGVERNNIIAKNSYSLEKEPSKGSYGDLMAAFAKELGEQKRADEEKTAGEEKTAADETATLESVAQDPAAITETERKFLKSYST
jgi:hypothetical protein